MCDYQLWTVVHYLDFIYDLFTRCAPYETNVYSSITIKTRALSRTHTSAMPHPVFHMCSGRDEGAGLHLRGLNLSITYTEMVYLLPHSCLSSGSEVHDMQSCTSMLVSGLTHMEKKEEALPVVLQYISSSWCLRQWTRPSHTSACEIQYVSSLHLYRPEKQHLNIISIQELLSLFIRSISITYLVCSVWIIQFWEIKADFPFLV